MDEKNNRRILTKWLLCLIFLSLFLSMNGCKKDKKGSQILDSIADKIKITKIDYFYTSGTKYGFHKDEYQKEIIVRVAINDNTEIKATLLNTSGFSKTVARSSNPNVFVLNSDGSNTEKELSEGDNFLTIYGNETLGSENTARIEVYGINNLNEEYLISGSNNPLNGICERNVYLKLFDLSEELPTGGILTDADKDIYKNLDFPLPRPLLDKTFFPLRFSLADAEVGYLSYRHPGHYRSQRGCGTCTFFSVIGTLEFETKRHLIFDLAYHPTIFDINFSEIQLILMYSQGGNGASACGVCGHFITGGYYIPLERYNCYEGASYPGNDNCNYTVFNIVEGQAGANLQKYNKICDEIDDYDELSIKYFLMAHNKPVRADIWVPNNLGGSKTYIDEKPSHDNVNHAVIIIGWDNNAEADGNMIGEAWIIRNSWISLQEFYLKMGEGYGNLRNLLVFTDVGYIDKDILIDDLMTGNNGDCYEDGDIYPETWSIGGEELRVGSSTQYSSMTKIFEDKQVSLLVNPQYHGGESIAAGNYIIDMYKLTFHVSYPKEGYDLDAYLPRTNTISGQTPILCAKFCIVENDDNGEADIVGFCAFVKFQVPGNIAINKWILAPPEACQIGYIYRFSGEFLGY